MLGLTTEVDGSYLGVLSGLFPMALGMGATFVSLTLVATTNVQEDDAGLASGIFNTSQQVGGALGVAVLSTIATSTTSNAVESGTGIPFALTDGFQAAFIGAAAIAVVGVLAAVALIRRDDLTPSEVFEGEPALELEAA
jgi:sugar phosphate permease